MFGIIIVLAFQNILIFSFNINILKYDYKKINKNS